MDFYCDHCGFHARFGPVLKPHGMLCEVCGIGTMRQGQCTSGFRVVANAIQAFVPAGQAVMVPYQPVVKGRQQYVGDLNYFSGLQGKPYMSFIQTETVYLGRFNRILVPDERRFSWLSPYTGSKHNQRHFIQAALAKVAIAQFKANGGVFPRLIEPFVGSGQVFLNSCHWGPSLNQGIPLFEEVIGGDLNPYVIGAYCLLRDHGPLFLKTYMKNAQALDNNFEASFKSRLNYLNAHGKLAVTGQATKKEEGTVDIAVMSYIYVVNRCVHGTKLNDSGGVTASPNLSLEPKLAEIRKRELATLTNVCESIGTTGTTQFVYQDFEATCKLAKPTDIVFMDCPFPKFTLQIPSGQVANPEGKSATASTYGVGDDGAQLQGRIVKVARDLINNGTTVILCNFANAGLVRAYTNLLQRDSGIPDEYRRWFTFTYCSPATTSEAYLLTILPGRGKVQLNDVPAQLRALWRQCGGDDNFGAAYEQQFFNIESDESDEGDDVGTIQGGMEIDNSMDIEEKKVD
jgi:site-specific DNA-adenine methylase